MKCNPLKKEILTFSTIRSSHMKKSLLFLSVCFLVLTACRTDAPEQTDVSGQNEATNAAFVFDREVYISENDAYVPANKETVLELWQTVLGDDFPKGAEFDAWSMSSARTGDLETGVLITAKSSKSAVSIGAVLEKDGDRFYLSERTKTATCRGCTEGCALKSDGSKFTCSGCDLSGKGCVKSEHMKVSAEGT